MKWCSYTTIYVYAFRRYVNGNNTFGSCCIIKYGTWCWKFAGRKTVSGKQWHLAHVISLEIYKRNSYGSVFLSSLFDLFIFTIFLSSLHKTLPVKYATIFLNNKKMCTHTHTHLKTGLSMLNWSYNRSAKNIKIKTVSLLQWLWHCLLVFLIIQK